eukprot:scaffold8621_cov67-Phaeocystis_antarctica.AAC.3
MSRPRYHRRVRGYLPDLSFDLIHAESSVENFSPALDVWEGILYMIGTGCFDLAAMRSSEGASTNGTTACSRSRCRISRVAPSGRWFSGRSASISRRRMRPFGEFVFKKSSA